jgi:hemolysin activation/secretion protein
MCLRIVALLTLLSVQAFTTMPAAAQPATDPPLVIEELQCRGNTVTSCAYILSHVYLSASSRVDEEEIRNSQFRLSALPNFTSVRIFLEKGSERGKTILVVEVVEANPLYTEALAGVANRGSHALAFRIGHQNLFGAGERLELTAAARIPVDGALEQETSYARLQYIDPTLFGADRYFFSASAVYFDGRSETRFGDELQGYEAGIDFMVGRRFADFSYVALGYRYLLKGKFDSTFIKDDGFVEVNRNDYANQLLLNYGWNSEDDPYFPTQGGRFEAGLVFTRTDSRFSNAPDFDPDDETIFGLSIGYRHTWSFGGRNYLRLEIGATPGAESRSVLAADDDFLTLGYERTLPASGLFAGIKRGRWYVDAKEKSFAISDGNAVHEVGLKAGLRLETRRFGLVELYVLGTTEL